MTRQKSFGYCILKKNLKSHQNNNKVKIVVPICLKQMSHAHSIVII